jgi:hypothetical protein
MTAREEMKEWLKQNPLTPEILDRIIYKFDLQNVDLLIEKERVEEKRSNLSARQRKAVLELVQMKSIMDEIELEKQNQEKIEETAVFSTN